MAIITCVALACVLITSIYLYVHFIAWLDGVSSKLVYLFYVLVFTLIIYFGGVTC